MGRIVAVFKADGADTAGGYSISEWWLDPRTTGPGAQTHVEDDVFYVIDGTMSVLVGDRWVEAPKGAFVLVPGGVTRDFENRSDARAGVLNFSHPGKFRAAHARHRRVVRRPSRRSSNVAQMRLMFVRRS